jgi:nitrite reductase (NAD(P)H)
MFSQLMFYIRTADRLVRTAPWVESFEGGIEVSLPSCLETWSRTDEVVQKLRKILIKDELGICADLEAEMDSLIGTYEDEWKRAVQDPDLRKQFRQFVNTVSVARRFDSLHRSATRRAGKSTA